MKEPRVEMLGLYSELINVESRLETIRKDKPFMITHKMLNQFVDATTEEMRLMTRRTELDMKLKELEDEYGFKVRKRN